MPETKPLSIADIRMDATQVRRATSEEPIARYMERYKARESMDPIDVCFDGTTYWLADGFHRVGAVQRIGGKSMQAVIHEGGRAQAWRMGCEKNGRHGLPRSNDDKRYAVGVCLADSEWSQWSDGAIAEHCAVSQAFVSKVRREQSGQNGFDLKPAPDAQKADSAPEAPKLRKGRDGKEYPAKKSGKEPLPRAASAGKPFTLGSGGDDTEGAGGKDAPPRKRNKSGLHMEPADQKKAEALFGQLQRLLHRVGLSDKLGDHMEAIILAIRGKA